MKKKIRSCIFLCLLLIFSIKSISQIKKGNLLLSGSVYFYSNNNDRKNSNATFSNSEINYTLTIQKAINNNFLLGIGIGQIHRSRNDIYLADSYYKSNDNFWDFNLNSEYLKKIEKNFFYSPFLSINYSRGKQLFKTKESGFQETISNSIGQSWGISVEPLSFSYFIKEKYGFSASFGKIIYSRGKNENNIPGNDIDGKGNTLSLNFTPYLSNIKISFIL